jgi:hypothetical protein
MKRDKANNPTLRELGLKSRTFNFQSPLGKKKKKEGHCMEAHTYITSTQEEQEFKASLNYVVRPCLEIK